MKQIEKKRIEIYTDMPARLASDFASYMRGEVKYDSRADASGGFDLTPVSRRPGEAIKLRVRNLGDRVSQETYDTLREACYSVVVLYGVSPDSIFLHGPARGIDLPRLRGEVAMEIDLQKRAYVKKEPSVREAA